MITYGYFPQLKIVYESFIPRGQRFLHSLSPMFMDKYIYGVVMENNIPIYTLVPVLVNGKVGMIRRSVHYPRGYPVYLADTGQPACILEDLDPDTVLVSLGDAYPTCKYPKHALIYRENSDVRIDKQRALEQCVYRRILQKGQSIAWTLSDGSPLYHCKYMSAVVLDRDKHVLCQLVPNENLLHVVDARPFRLKRGSMIIYNTIKGIVLDAFEDCLVVLLYDHCGLPIKVYDEENIKVRNRHKTDELMIEGHRVAYPPVHTCEDVLLSWENRLFHPLGKNVPYNVDPQVEYVEE